MICVEFVVLVDLLAVVLFSFEVLELLLLCFVFGGGWCLLLVFGIWVYDWCCL